MRAIYLSGAPRLSTRPDTESLGPRSHMLGVVGAMQRAGLHIDEFVVGDMVPASVGREGSERRMTASRWRIAGADVVRLSLRAFFRARLAARTRGAEYTIVYERYALFQELGSRLRKRAWWVLEVNAMLAVEATSERRATTSARLARAFERRTIRRADLVVAVSRTLADDLVEAYDLDPGRVLVMPNGIDPTTARVSSTRVGDPQRIRVAFIGSMYRWQGLDALLRALVGLEHVELHIAGDGPERESLVRLAHTLNIDHRVVFHGRIHPDDVSGFLAGNDVGFAGHTSANGAYFSPLKLWEYIANGLPVITSKTADAQTLVDEGLPVVTFDPDDASSLHDALRTVHEHRAALQQQARSRRQDVLARHSWDARVQPLLARLGVAR